MQDQLNELKQEALAKVIETDSRDALQKINVAYLGRRGSITTVLRGMGKLSPEERPIVGKLANEVRQAIERAIETKKSELEAIALEAQLKEETIDVTLPGRPVNVGGPHLLTQVIEEIEDLFIGLGYEVREGPEVEKDYYNFEALNLPKGHPARDMQDSFYITNELLLRTHTSPVQARTMESLGGKEPVRMICPGKVYRRDNDDATHSHQFTQIEGLYVDTDVRMSDLKGTLDVFAKKMFGEDCEIRLRPSFFPFTELSVEMDIFRSKEPVRIICPGKIYRRDNNDATHSHQFNQIEGLYVDTDVRMSDLKGTLDVFAKKMFGEDREIRLRPSFFPFTEPSVEMDISCKM